MIKKLCPCHSKKTYDQCCQCFHQGEFPPTALALMRSRYSAYALGLAVYIIKTTHKDNPQYLLDTKLWIQSILQFSKNTSFVGLDILEFIDGETEAYVTFVAHLKQGTKDTSFQEKSRFLKEGQQWKYVSGTQVTR